MDLVCRLPKTLRLNGAGSYRPSSPDAQACSLHPSNQRSFRPKWRPILFCVTQWRNLSPVFRALVVSPLICLSRPQLSPLSSRCYSSQVSPVALPKPSDESAASREQALLEVAESVAHHRGLAELFHDLAGRLHRVAHFDYSNLILHDPERQVMRVHILETQQPTRIRPGAESPMHDAPAGQV